MRFFITRVGYVHPQFSVKLTICAFSSCGIWQPGYGYQQQLVPGMRPGGPPMPNFFVPMVPQGQQGQRQGGRRAGAGPVQPNQQPVPMMQQQQVGAALLYLYMYFFNKLDEFVIASMFDMAVGITR